MLSYGQLANMLNGPGHKQRKAPDVHAAIADSVRVYDSWPEDMRWNATK